MSDAKNSKLRLATVGLGNWAGQVVDLLVQEHLSTSGTIELVSVFEPDLIHHSDRVNALTARGVKVVNSFDQILEDTDVQAVLLPIPIHLHRPLTEQALLAGKAVLVEKPVAGCVQDVDAMIAARDHAKLPVLVGFQHMYDPKLLELKRAVLCGVIGSIRSVTVIGCGPRDRAYYSRTPWAGRIRHEGAWVLDSPTTNAFAHYLNLALFLLGTTEASVARPTNVAAELYRTYEIENYDTASLRFMVEGIPLLAMFTHACRYTVGPRINVIGSKGTLQVDLNEKVATIVNGANQRLLRLSCDPRVEMLRAFAKCVQRQPLDSLVCTLEAARMHVIATNGASQAAMVTAIPERSYISAMTTDGKPHRYIPGIEDTMSTCMQRGELLHESGWIDWTTAPGVLSLNEYHTFEGTPKAPRSIEAAPS